MTFSEVEVASEFYGELRGDPPSEEEIVSDRDVGWIKYYKPMPVSFGFEIEQLDTDVCSTLRFSYDWHYDGSGPYETALPPSVYPGRMLKGFIDRCRTTPDCTWKWKSEIDHPRAPSRRAGCGSHIHFRPRQEIEYISAQWVAAWTTAFNTLVEVVPLVLPMFCYGRERDAVFTFRREALYWAHIVRRRVSEATTMRFLDPGYSGHPYDAVAWNKSRETKPLTIELRLNETHPSIAYELAILLNRIIRKCFERGFVSPKMTDRVHMIEEIERHTARSIERQENLYTILEMVEDIRFMRGREIPLLDQGYPNYIALFKDILRNYGHPYPPMGRVCRLFLHEGEPWRNPSALWNTFVPYGEFKWDQEIPSR